MSTTDSINYRSRALLAEDALVELRAEVERLKKLEVWFTEAIDALHADVDQARAEVTTLEWQLSEATKAAERFQAALEEIADVAHPPDMRAANIARVALGR